MDEMRQEDRVKFEDRSFIAFALGSVLFNASFAMLRLTDPDRDMSPDYRRQNLDFLASQQYAEIVLEQLYAGIPLDEVLTTFDKSPDMLGAFASSAWSDFQKRVGAERNLGAAITIEDGIACMRLQMTNRSNREGAPDRDINAINRAEILALAKSRAIWPYMV